MVQTAERQKVQYLILPLLPYNPDVTSVPRARLGGLAAPFITQCPELKLALSIPCLLATLFFLCPFSFPLLARAGGSVDWWSGVLFATGLQLLYSVRSKQKVRSRKHQEWCVTRRLLCICKSRNPCFDRQQGGGGCNSRRCWTCPCLSLFSIRLCSASGRWHLGRLNSRDSPEHAERVSSCLPPTGQLFLAFALWNLA